MKGSEDEMSLNTKLDALDMQFDQVQQNADIQNQHVRAWLP